MGDHVLPRYFPFEVTERLQALDSMVPSMEVKRALFDMSPFKAPAQDGFHTFFYQHNWEVVGPLVVRFVCSIFEGSTIVRSANSTHIVLIPKMAQSEYLHNFRPISLCNVSYKLVAKIIANWLQSLLPDLISPNQANFVPGRHIQDNIYIAQELIHTMSRM